MNTRYSLDQESLQEFLANAYAVQKCGLDRESLGALIELERFITTGDFDEDQVLQIVADRALKVSNAGGVSIALLQGNELVYRAGSGSAANDVGHHVPAVLSVSPEAEVRKEILRVENAQTDTRVEADVCRQFGANSLLMLPIYENHGLAGVMQILFGGAHAFLDREMRTYRLMVRALEGWILFHPHRARQQFAASAVEQKAGDRIDLRHQPLENVKPLAVIPDAVEQNVSQRGAAQTDDDRSENVVPKPSRLPNVHFWRGGAAVTAAIMVAIVIWATFHNRPTRATPGLAFSTVRGGTGQQAPGQPLSVDNATKPASNRPKDTPPKSAFRRVRIGPKEVDYISEDVTIRQFRTAPAKPQTQSSEKETNFGDDVTVRYYAYTPTTAATPRTSSEATAPTKHIMPASR